MDYFYSPCRVTSRNNKKEILQFRGGFCGQELFHGRVLPLNAAISWKCRSGVTLRKRQVTGTESKFFKVEKIRFPSKENKSKIIFNSKITIENIPSEAYEYVVNGKNAIEWIMERHQITVNKDSGIRNDPNDMASENPRNILDFLLSVVWTSVETVVVVKGLPSLLFDISSY